jgi:hypothetical protein
MMVRNTFGGALASRAFARAVAPYVVAQLVVLGVVLAFPAIVWRSGAAEPLEPAAGRALTDDETRTLFQQQLDRNEGASGPDAPPPR